MKLMALLLLIVSSLAHAHQLEMRSQYWWLKGPDVKSWRQDFMALINVKPAHHLLATVTHFERFNEQDQQLMLGWLYKNSKGYYELTHAHGGGNRILARRDTQFSHGRPLILGFDAWINLKAQGYQTNDLHMGTVGLGKEWVGGYFAIVSAGAGRATYFEPSSTEDVWGLGTRLGMYREDNWKAWLAFSQGEEAQALVAIQQTRPLRFMAYGGGVEKDFLSNFRARVVLERSYYRKVNTRLDSIAGHLVWNWDAP